MKNTKLDLFIKWLFQKSTILFGLILISFFIFNPTITKIIDKVFVLYFTSCVTKPSILIDFFAIIITTVIILFYYRKKLDYVPSSWFATVILLIFIFYFYYRFYHQTWGFVSFYFCENIKYLDIIIPIAILNSSLWLSNYFYPRKEPLDRMVSLLTRVVSL